MAETVAVNTGGLKRTAGDMLVVSDATHGIVNTLRETLDPLGAPWGDDEAGKAFAANYVQPAADWQTTVIGIGDVLKSTSDRILEMANSYETTEVSNTIAANGGSTPPPAGS